MPAPENRRCGRTFPDAGHAVRGAAIALVLAALASRVCGPRGCHRVAPARRPSFRARQDDVHGAAAGETGVRTENRYDDPRMWGDLYQEFEGGSIGTGVAIGDYDGDGRPDIFVVSKTEGCRLFRNLGGYKFEDVTEKAGVGDRAQRPASGSTGRRSST